MILCCGEALIDMIPSETTDENACYTPCPGGAVFNTAIALGRLGTPVAMLSGVSTDKFGQLLANTLRDNHVQTDWLVRSDLLTTLAVVHLQDGHATYGFYDENSAGRMLTQADLPALPRAVSALYFGGISLVSPPAANSYASLLDRAGAGRVVMIDPNIRPGFITDEASYRARLDRMIAQSDIVKVSDEDLNWIVGDAGDLDAQARSILAKGPSVVIVTQGAKGAMAITPKVTVHQPAVQTTCVDTVGAGDTFNAGVLAALDADGHLTPQKIATLGADALHAALGRGAQVAAVTVSRVGANPPWADELPSA